MPRLRSTSSSTQTSCTRLPFGTQCFAPAAAGFYQLPWNKDILDEMERNLREGKDSVGQGGAAPKTMETYFPEWAGMGVTSAELVNG
jgi:hypothetical protein